ncbi:MAG: globin domain-containing protein [Phycisphaerae bacterium]
MKFTIHPLSTVEDMHGTHPASQGGPVKVDAALAHRLDASFQMLASHGDALAAAFYRRLLSDNPALRPLFPTDMTAQREKLTATLAWVAGNLEDRPAVTAALAQLGKRHNAYGARPEHYPPVVEALLGAMREVGQDRFDARAEADWRTALELICERMIRAQEAQAAG